MWACSGTLYADEFLLHHLITCFVMMFTMNFVIIPHSVTESKQMQVLAHFQEKVSNYLPFMSIDLCLSVHLLKEVLQNTKYPAEPNHGWKLESQLRFFLSGRCKDSSHPPFFLKHNNVTHVGKSPSLDLCTNFKQLSSNSAFACTEGEGAGDLITWVMAYNMT